MTALYMFLVFLLPQMLFWLLMIKGKQIKSLITTILIGGLGIFVFSRWFYGNVIIDPCAGIPDCMNETGMIFVFSLFIMIVSNIVSALVLLVTYQQRKRGRSYDHQAL